eukprot:Tamp_19407.p1 GENE.Tamp_19407~~Tamp_19407.p1  ORF type:complete len:217 (+),score=8.01 Tamp_19407:250-900(+)
MLTPENNVGIMCQASVHGAKATPVCVDGFKPGVCVMSVALGGAHSACVTRDGDVYTWGCGSKGQLGHGIWESLTSKGRLLDKAAPELVETRHVRRCCLQVSCGDAHTAVVTRQGKLYTFGCGAAGRLGHGDKKPRVTPQEVCGALSARAVGRVWTLSLQKQLAFIMLSHPRLGVASAAEAVPGDVLRRILELAVVMPEAAYGYGSLCHIVGGRYEE